MREEQKQKGWVRVRTYLSDTREMVQENVFPNTILKIGRRAAIASLGGNILGNGHTAYVSHMAFGIGGADNFGNLLPVSEDQTGFIGGASNVKDTVAVKASILPAPEPSIVIMATLPPISAANGFKLSQMGLVLSDGTYYSVTTWDGPNKNPSRYQMVEWTLDYL